MTEAWIDPTFNTTEGIWNHDNNEPVIWQYWAAYHSIDFTTDPTNITAHLRSDGKFARDIHPSESASIFCEQEYGMYLLRLDMFRQDSLTIES